MDVNSPGYYPDDELDREARSEIIDSRYSPEEDTPWEEIEEYAGILSGAVRYDTLGGTLYGMQDTDWNETATPDFKPDTLIGDEAKLRYTPDTLSALKMARSEEEFRYIQETAEDEMEYRNLVNEHGLLGWSAATAAGIFGDPTTYAAAPVAWVSKGGRLAQAVKSGLVAVGTNVPPEVLSALESNVKDEDDVLYTAMGSAFLGSMAGAFFGKADHLPPASVSKMDETLGNASAAIRATQDKELAGMVVDHTKPMQKLAAELETQGIETLGATPHVTPLEAEIPTQSAGAMRRESGVFDRMGEFTEANPDTGRKGISMGAVISRSKNGEFQAIGDKMFEAAGGKKNGATLTAGLMRDRTVQELSEVHPEFRAAYDMYAKAEGINLFSKSFSLKHKLKFNREIRDALSELSMGRTPDMSHLTADGAAAIRKAVAAHQNTATKMMRIQSDAGLIDGIIDNPHYFQRRWSPGAIWKIQDKISRLGLDGKAVVKDWFMRGLRSAAMHSGVPMESATDEVLSNIASAIITRFTERAAGAGTSTIGKLDADSLEFILASVKDHMPPEDVLHIEKLLTAKAQKKSGPGYLKRGSLIDLGEAVHLPDGTKLKLHDLLEGTLERNLASQIRSVAGNSAMAHMGFKSRADFDRALVAGRKSAMANWRELGYKSQDAAASAAENEAKILETGYKLMLGENVHADPGSVTSKVLQHVKDMTSITSLGGMGITQLAETSRVFAQVGVVNCLKSIPALRAMARNTRFGKITPQVAELEAALGYRLGGEYYRNPFILRDDWGGLTASGRAEESAVFGHLYETSIHVLKQGLGYASGHRFIQEAQNIIQMNAMAAKFKKAALQDKAWDKRLGDIGIDKAMWKQVKKSIKKYGTGDTMGLDRWTPSIREPLLDAMHRANTISIQRQLIGETPHWLHSHLGEILGQFRTFPIVAMEKQTGRELRMHDTESVMTTIYAMSIGTAMYMAKLNVNTAGMGKYQREEYLEKYTTPTAMAQGAASMGGVFSMVPDVWQTFQTAFSIPSPYDSRGITANADQNLWNLFPATSKLNSIYKAVQDTSGVVTGENEYTPGMHKNLFRLIPLGNTAMLRAVANATAPDNF